MLIADGLFLDTGYWILDTGYWMLDTGCWILDAIVYFQSYVYSSFTTELINNRCCNK
ncbi:MAG: hypothetical protein K8R63_07575 [Bacteroidales bacterium]|nr:hypothetical protein [Bacteroidales bacterium]